MTARRRRTGIPARPAAAGQARTRLVRAAKAARTRVPLALAAAAALALVPLAAARASANTTLTLQLRSNVIAFGQALTVGGTIDTGATPVAGAAVELELDRYPYDGFVVISSARSAADGTFSFADVRPSRNARLRVVEAGDPSVQSAAQPVTVNPDVTLSSRVLGPGRTLLSATAVHTRSYGSPPVGAYWYLAPRGSLHFQFVAMTETREARPGVTTMSAIVDPAERQFSFVVCFVPAWARAMGHPSARRPCRAHDFVALHPGASR